MDVAIEKKKFSRKRILIFLGIVSFVLLIIYTFISSQGGRKLNINKERLTISTVTEGMFQENIPVNGVVLPLTSIYLDALEGGRIEEKYVEDGTILKAGDPILRLSNTDLELSLVNQETQVYNLLTQMQISKNAARQNTISKLTQYTDAENGLIEAERQYELNKKLFDKGVVAKQEMIKSENHYNYQKERMQLSKQVLSQDSLAVRQESGQLQNSYARTQSALELMRRKVADLIVRAPVDGQITSMDAEIGQSKSKGERLGQIDILNGFKVRAEIDEHYIARIFIGQTGSFPLNGKIYKLAIDKVFTQVKNGRFQVDLKFIDEVPAGIRRGQTLQVKLSLSDEKLTLMIPKGGFFQNTGGGWIFKLSTDGGRAYKTEIIMGSQNTESYEVLSGLSAGDNVITSTYENFVDIEELILKE